MGEMEHTIAKEIVSGIVVTFHPTREDLKNIAAMRKQVDLLFVVDNGSADCELSEIRREAQRLGFTLIENGANLGIAAALNRGVREAQQKHCQWVVLFDQDSTLTEGFVATMISDFKDFRREREIMQIIPRYVDPKSGVERPTSRYEDGGVFLTITSGSLFPMEVFDKCGLFQENLFIYCVDDDYSLRIRASGYFIGRSSNAVLMHRSGHPSSRKFFGITLSTSNHRAEARYYLARNKVWILRKYGRAFPRLIFPTLRGFISIPLRIAILEDAAWNKLKLFLRGLLDGVAGRMGPLGAN